MGDEGPDGGIAYTGVKEARRNAVPLAGSQEEKDMIEEQKNAWKKDFHQHEGPMVTLQSETVPKFL